MSASLQSLPTTRVLLVHSTTDSITDDRILAIKSRVESMNLDVRHFSIFWTEDAKEFSGEAGVKPSQWIKNNQEKILRRLTETVDRVGPEYLLLHTGMAFTFAPETILNVLSELKRQFPGIVFGIQRSKTLQMTLREASSASIQIRIGSLFDHSPRTEDLLQNLLP